MGAICSQRDAITDSRHLRGIRDNIHALNAATSPVIETTRTHIFRNKVGQSPGQVIRAMYQAAADTLAP